MALDGTYSLYLNEIRRVTRFFSFCGTFPSGPPNFIKLNGNAISKLFDN
jgi:hypothetical protein